ncbi:hypothetical protein VNO77_44766 [Canavalia gladiata]|uniref:C2H2-type domain-containing protein n=1 Tax=Canavalia gladiata TaxID=3824 RepID=A0AAN9JXA2_CANGL
MEKENDDKGVSDHEVESYEEEEKVKRSCLGSSCKVEAESVTAEEDHALNNSTPTTITTTTTQRVCDICFKTFSNGKALGGHRRSHFQASKKHQQKKVKARFSNHSKTGDNSNYNRANCDYDDDGGGDDNDDDDDPLMCDGKFICFLCKKEFPSKNALFGHMRSHPERTWRGLQPPPSHRHFQYKHSNSPSSSSSHHFDSSEKNDKEGHQEEEGDFVDKVVAPDEKHKDKVTDLSLLTSPSWLKKDKRGRRCLGLYAAAETLAYIYAYAKNFRGETSGNNNPKVDPIKSPQAPINKGIKIGESSSSAEKHVVKKIKFFLSGEMKMEERPNGGADSDDRAKGGSSGVERVLANDDDDDEEEEEEETPRRLQGHDERKRKKVETGKKSEKLVLGKSKSKDSEHENEEKLGGYKCSTCGKSFSSFQGLGGHRSIHKEKNIVVSMDAPTKHGSHSVAEENHSSSSSSKMDIEPSLNEESLPDHETSQSTATKLKDFDLNEPYVLDEDED